MTILSEIAEIEFGLKSSDEIRAESVAKIDSSKLTGGPGTVYDDRMGTIDNEKICETCKEGAKDCPGHFGHVELNVPIIHPLFYKHVTDLLGCFCIDCNRLLLLEDQIALYGMTRSKGRVRFKKLLEKLEKIDECCHCGHPQPQFKFSPTENTVSMVYKRKEKDELEKKINIVLTVEEIKQTLEGVVDEDVRLLGLDPDQVHPRNFIMTAFPVIPPCARPYVVSDGNICDDDLTNAIVEIIKANNHLDPEAEPKINETKQQKHLQTLKFRVFTFYNNSSGRAKHTTNNRPFKCLKQRLAGNVTGRVRH